MEKKEKLYEKIYADLLSSIKSGEWKNGDKLPTEWELAEHYGVSRITARTAVNLLEEKNLVRRERRNGTFVKIGSGKKHMTFPLVLPYNECINTEIIGGAQEYGLSVSCSVPMYNTFNRPEKEREILEKLLIVRPDGICLYPCSLFENLDVVSRLCAAEIPLVFIDREIPGTDCTLVSSDNRKAMYDLAVWLVRQGYRRIGYYGLHRNMIAPEIDRFAGYCMGLSLNKIGVEKQYLYDLPDLLTEAYRIAHPQDIDMKNSARKVVWRILSAKIRPEIVCCANDYTAATLAAAAAEAGIKVPEQLGITGFDDIEMSRTCSPMLTTIAQNFFELGRSAVDALYKQLQGERPARRIRVDTRFLIRDSVRLLGK